MKFIKSSGELLKQLRAIDGVITTNPVVPILENFLFEINDGVLTITASDLQTTLIAEIEVTSKENGSIAVPARILVETLKNLPDQPVTFSVVQETYSIEISSNNGRYKLAGENTTDFPKVPEVSNDFNMKLSTEILANAINYTIFATSGDELRPAMTGVYVHLSDTDTTFVATDGHRLVRYRRTDVSSEDNNHTVIIPRNALNFLKKTIPNEDIPVSAEFSVTNAFFKFGNIRMTCRLIDERYPEYNNVIPLENNNVMTVDRVLFINSLRRIAIYANQTTHQVRLILKGSQLTVSAEDLDFANEAKENIECNYNGEDIEMGFNGKFLIEMLENIETDEIELHLATHDIAGLIFPKFKYENENILMLIMPVMLDSYE